MCYIINSNGHLQVITQSKNLSQRVLDYLAKHSITSFLLRSSENEPIQDAVLMSI